MITVLVTTYEQTNLLRRAVWSLYAQSDPDWEAVILDDGSVNPEVKAVLREFADPRITVERFRPTIFDRQSYCTLTHNINWGAERTKGEFITYLCADDFFFPDRLERMGDKLREGHDVVYGSQLLIDEDGRQIGLRRTDGVLDDAYERVDHNSVMHTRKSFWKAGGWPTAPDIWRIPDARFWRRLTDAGYLFVPVEGDPTDCKSYRGDSVDMRCREGRSPWE
jgi:glycosyltransferase involved in cell wall biosynthesis